MAADGMTESDLYAYIGQRIRLRRQALGLSQEDVAGSIGYGRVSLTQAENGRQRTPLHVFWLLARKLEVNLRDLLPDMPGGVWDDREERRQLEAENLVLRAALVNVRKECERALWAGGKPVEEEGTE